MKDSCTPITSDSTKDQTSVLVLGDHRQSLTVFRSLARAGYHIIFGTQRARSFSRRSRYVDEIWMHAPIEDDPHEFIAGLTEFVRAQKISLIFPIGEKQLECITRFRADINTLQTKVIMPDDSAIISCLNKTGVCDVAVNLGIPCAEFHKAHDCAELISIADSIGYPCVVKPNDSHTPFFGLKAIIARSATDLQTSLSSWPAGNNFLIVQKYIGGQRHNCYFGAVSGKLRAFFQWTTTRTNRLDGTGIAVEGISVQPDRIMQAHCEKLVAELNYSGVGCVQFIVDEESRTAYFLEINPRLGATCAFAYGLGFDFPLIALECVLYGQDGKSADLNQAWHYPVGKRYHWPEGDIHELSQSINKRELNLRIVLSRVGQMINAFLRADVHEMWSWRDPLPTIAFYASLVTSCWHRSKRQVARFYFGQPRRHKRLRR